MNVFLSHSTTDREVAEALASALKGEEIFPWLCEADVAPGEDFVAEIEAGLSASNLAILLWSEAASKSSWTGVEWRSVLAREVEESRTRLCVVVLDATPLPQVLRNKQFINGDGSPEGVRRVVEWAVAQRESRRYQASAAAKFLLDVEPQDFVGRADYMDVLDTALCAKRGRYLLWGEPGSGKSLLASKFAWRSQGAFDAVVYQHCGQRAADVIGVELAERLGLSGQALSPAEQLDAAQTWLCERRTLLILDDVWNDEVETLLPTALKSVASLSVLCTSRRQTLPWNDMTQRCQVTAFTPEESLQLYRLCLGEAAVTRHCDAISVLAARFEHLPIAVSVSARLLQYELDPLEQVAQTLVLERLRDAMHDVPALLAHAIAQQTAPAQQLLWAMAFCDEAGFWLPLAGRIAGLSGTDTRTARDQLVHRSLVQAVDRDRQWFRLHALLREQLTETMTDVAALADSHALALEAVLAEWEDDWASARECLAEVIPAISHLWQADEVDRMAGLAYHGYALGLRIGELDAAHRIVAAEQALWATRDDSGAKNGLQRTYGNQALILQAWGQLDAAMALLKQQEALCIELGNQDSLQRSYGNQALILQDRGQLDEAMDLHEKQEALCIELGNQDSLQISYGNQALILKARGQLDEAMALLTQQEALCNELGNKDSLQKTYGNQALILQDRGQLDEAMDLHKKQEALCIELGNKDNLQTGYGNQAGILKAWGQLDEAMALHKKQEALCIELGLRSGLGYCYWAWGQLARCKSDTREAQKKLREALDIFEALKMPNERASVRKDLDALGQSEGDEF